MGRKVSFWIAVGAVSILSNYAVEVATPYFPPGLAKFAHKLHKGAS